MTDEPNGNDKQEEQKPQFCQVEVRQGDQYMQSKIAVVFPMEAVEYLQRELPHSLQPANVVSNFLGSCQYAMTLAPVPLPKAGQGIAVARGPLPPGPGGRKGPHLP